MFPSFLITFREVIEASLIIATIIGILTKLKQTNGIKTVWQATLAASAASVALLIIGSLLGFKLQSLYTGASEKLIEGLTMIFSAVFITWAVFFLHKYFSRYKVKLLTRIKEAVEQEEKTGLFLLVFTAVIREGIEVVLFLSTVYLSSRPAAIIEGFFLGALLAIITSLALFASIIKLPLYQAFRGTSILLIFFAAGLLGRGVHEFIELGVIPNGASITLSFIPHVSTIPGTLINVVFGVSSHMNTIQIAAYSLYVVLMSWWVFFRKRDTQTHVAQA